MFRYVRYLQSIVVDPGNFNFKHKNNSKNSQTLYDKIQKGPQNLLRLSLQIQYSTGTIWQCKLCFAPEFVKYGDPDLERFLIRV
jgi:hypothetical protein